MDHESFHTDTLSSIIHILSYISRNKNSTNRMMWLILWKDDEANTNEEDGIVIEIVYKI